MEEENLKDCLFCCANDYIMKNELAKARYDGYPVSKGHMVFVTKRCVPTFFETTEEERFALFALIDKAKKMLDDLYHPNGYNIGINCGEASGQTIMHIHIHLIPRYLGDVANPRGGIRGVIPEKQNYLAQNPKEELHKLKLYGTYFNLIKKGQKVLECRLNDEKRQKIKIGDTLEFSNIENEDEKINAKIVDIYKFKSFNEMATTLNVEALGFSGLSTTEIISIYHSIYSEENELKYGVIVFKIKLI